MINDLSIITGEILHSDLAGQVKYPSNFIFEEVPILNFYTNYLKALKEKILIKKEVAKIVIEQNSY